MKSYSCYTSATQSEDRHIGQHRGSNSPETAQSDSTKQHKQGTEQSKANVPTINNNRHSCLTLKLKARVNLP
ncbi:uncharacterized [Tachysurus ichikawai]